MHKLYTVGYGAGWTVLALRDLVDGLGAMLVDVRLKAWSKTEEWREGNLAALFLDWYRHCPSLGNRNYQGGQVQIADLPRGMEFLRRQLEQHPVVIMCGCRDPRECHRQFVADSFAERFGAEVEHLPGPGDLPPLPGWWKVLTLTQMWATLVMIEAKKIETRSWATSYRGPLLIHSGKTFPAEIGGKTGFLYLCSREPFRSVLAAAGYNDPEMLPLGCLLGSIQLTRCSEFTERNTANLSAQELAFGDFSLGRFGFKLENPRPLAQPIPARGYQQLWNWQQTEDLEFADSADGLVQHAEAARLTVVS